ncbi:MAG: FAD-dependent oxidoreductase [Nitrospira sp.]|nr:FAD-dependent oxidoreductase [Nitrospira sp.]
MICHVSYRAQLEALSPGHGGVVDISATMRLGLDELRGTIRTRLMTSGLESREGVLVTKLRHIDACSRALLGVRQAQQSVADDRAGELIAVDLHIAADALGEITGVITTDDILERIFPSFVSGNEGIIVMGERCDVIVVGEVTQGVKPLWPQRAWGARTLLLTMDPDRIAQMSCNPAIGGIAKGHLVKRSMPWVVRWAGIRTRPGRQFRMINTSKGPAVRALRAQCDKGLSTGHPRKRLTEQPGLDLGGAVARVLTHAGAVTGIITDSGMRIQARRRRAYVRDVFEGAHPYRSEPFPCWESWGVVGEAVGLHA